MPVHVYLFGFDFTDAIYFQGGGELAESKNYLYQGRVRIVAHVPFFPVSFLFYDNIIIHDIISSLYVL